MRIGLGFDVHRFSKKKKDLVLGGVVVPSALSLRAVSDGDLILHAISDAICGAAGLGDIGDYFPPPAKESKGIDSREIVKFVLKKINKKYRIYNIDVTIVSEKPRLVKYKRAITLSLRKIFRVKDINLKIKSKEGLDILGSKNSMSCLVIALLKKK